MVGQRINSFRFSPESFPLPGFPCLVLAGDQALTLAVFEEDELTKQGISMGDLQTFMETPSGKQFVKEFSILSKLMPNECAYIPAGCLPIIMYIGSKEAEASAPFTHFCVYNIFSVAAAKAVCPQTWQGIVTLTKRYLAGVSGSRVFAQRAELMDIFDRAADAARGTT